jgi:hypothetical protein
MTEEAVEEMIEEVVAEEEITVVAAVAEEDKFGSTIADLLFHICKKNKNY